jgi:hypothetical protein
MHDPIRKLTALRAALEAERRRILERLAGIDLAFGAVARSSMETAPRPRGNGASSVSLVDAVRLATKDGPLNIRELVPAVQRHGFTFASRDPVNSLGAYLYGKKGRVHFKKVKRGFLSR